MNKNPITYKWHALYTRSRQEKKVYAELNKRGFIAFLPLETTMRQWSDRKKKVEAPMIPSYVFVKASEIEYYDILNVNGAVRYVTFEGKAAAIPEWQIEAMQVLKNHNSPHYYSRDKFLKGEKVKLESGPLRGFKGEVIKVNNSKSKLIIRIANIGYSLVMDNIPGTIKKI